MQLSFRQKAQFFHELAQLVRSSVTLPAALEMLSRNKFSRSGRCAAALRKALAQTGGASTAFAQTGFDASDIAIIQAGELAGQLEAIFAELAAYYAQLADSRHAVISASLYPLLVFHLGVVLLAIPPAIMGNGWPTFFTNVIPLLVGFYVFIGIILFVWKTTAASYANSRAIAEILVRIPLLGHFLTNWSGWRFTAILSLYVRAGGGVIRGLETAGSSCGSAILASATRGVGQQLQGGQGLGIILRHRAGVPEAIERAVEVGEHAGRLDEEIQRAMEILKTRTLAFLAAFTAWTPRLFYILVLLIMGWRIISTVMQIGNSVNDALNMES